MKMPYLGGIISEEVGCTDEHRKQTPMSFDDQLLMPLADLGLPTSA